MIDKGLAALKRRAAAVWRDDTGLFAADIAGLPMTERKVLAQHMAGARVQEALANLFASAVADSPIGLGELTTAAVGCGQDYRGLNNKPGRNQHDRAHHQALPHRRAGLRPIAGLAGVRVLRAVGVDDRPRDAAGVLPDVWGADVRRGSPIHLEVRGAPAGRLIDGADPAAVPVSERAHDDHARAPRRGLLAQAKDAARVAEHQPSRAKGRADGEDGAAHDHGRDGHGR
jgi:hypothetical protein